MDYPYVAIPDSDIPNARVEILQHAVDTYVGETNKLATVWRQFTGQETGFRPDERSSTVLDILRHELLSQRRFFAEFLGCPEPAAGHVLPAELTPAAATERLVELTRARLTFLADQPESWWTARVTFFDVERQRIWIFWRRILHTAHHRTQLTMYLRMLGKPVVPTYGPTADISWTGADPTRTVEAASRGGTAR